VTRRYFGEIGGERPAWAMWAVIEVQSLFPEKDLVEIQVMAAYAETK